MKMKIILNFAYLIILTLFIGCDDMSSDSSEAQTAVQQQEVTFPDSLAYITKEHKRVFPECEGEDCTTYTLEYIELTDEKYGFINDSIKVALVGTYASIDDAAEAFFDEYEEVTFEMTEEYFNPPWSQDLTVDVDLNEKGLLTLNYFSYSYYGGAHGMPSFSSVNYDLKTKQELALYDLVNIEDSTKLTVLGEKYFRIDNEIEPYISLSDAGYFWSDIEFYMSDVFTVTKDGLMFTYSPYEIASYAAGMPDFTIPYKDLQPHFTENSPLKRLME